MISVAGEHQESRVYAERFLDAWKRLSNHLRMVYDGPADSTRTDDSALIRWAYRSGVLREDSFTFVDRCRQARNAYAHVVFEGYQGPIAVPPRPVVYRLERLANAMVNPPKVTAVSVPAVTCAATTSILEALRIMRHENFSQLPYLSDDLGWVLITRDHVSRWVEYSAESDAACLLDLTHRVNELSGLAGVSPVLPKKSNRNSLLADAVEELAAAFQTPDHSQGGYPLILVVDEGSTSPEVLAAEDLPRAYEVLGR